MKPLVIVLTVVLGACARQAAPPPAPASGSAPSTDIYLYRLGRSLIPFRSRLTNITHRTGYDNQPYWDGPTVLYTSIRGGQADIYRHTGDSTVQVTATAESEYSPSITPDGLAISVVRVERDSTQRLWRFPLDGRAPTVVLPNVRPVGYYAWLDSALVALYVLGSPDTLQIADARTGVARVVTTDIGRSLQRMPGGRRASFVRRENGRWVLRTVAPEPGLAGAYRVQTVAVLPDSAEYVTWRSATEAYAGSGSRLFRLRLPSRVWQQIADLHDDGIRGISRLAVSPDGELLAIVAGDQAEE